MPLKSELLFDPENEWMRGLPIWFNGFGRAQITLDKNYYLHQWILNKEPNLDIDHINGNVLDNRKSNLRLVTRSQNLFNRQKRKNSTQKLKGVQLLPSGKYRAKGPSGAHWGCFNTAEEAYDKFIENSKKLYGEDFVNNCKNITGGGLSH